MTHGQAEFLAYPVLDDVFSFGFRGGIEIKQDVRIGELWHAVYARHAGQVEMRGRHGRCQFQKLVLVPVPGEDGSPVVRFSHGEVVTGYLEIDDGVFRCSLYRLLFSSGLVVAVQCGGIQCVFFHVVEVERHFLCRAFCKYGLPVRQILTFDKGRLSGIVLVQVALQGRRGSGGFLGVRYGSPDAGCVAVHLII